LLLTKGLITAGWYGDAIAGSGNEQSGREDQMLWTIAVILIILWLLGLVTGYTMGYFIHILLVVAIIVVLVRVIQGRRPLSLFGSVLTISPQTYREE